MKKVGSLLSSTLKALGIEEGMRLRTIQKEWSSIFAEPLSLHTCPVEIKDGDLLVNVDSPVWLQQLKFLKQDILERLKPYGVKDIRLKHGRLYRYRQRASDEQHHQMVKKPCKTHPVDSAWLEGIVSGIQDPELKEELRRTITKAVMRNP